MAVIVVIGVMVLYNNETFDNNTMIIMQGNGNTPKYPVFDFNRYMDTMTMHMYPGMDHPEMGRGIPGMLYTDDVQPAHQESCGM